MLKLFLKKRWFLIVLFVLLILFKKEPIKIFAQEAVNRLDIATGGLLIRNPSKGLDQTSSLFFLEGEGAPNGGNTVAQIKTTTVENKDRNTGKTFDPAAVLEIWTQKVMQSGDRPHERTGTELYPALIIDEYGSIRNKFGDFHWDNRPGILKFKTRSLLLEEIDDPVDIEITRAGGKYPYGPKKPLEGDGANLGRIDFAGLTVQKGQERNWPYAQIWGAWEGGVTGSLTFKTGLNSENENDNIRMVIRDHKVGITTPLEINKGCKGCADLAEDYISAQNLEAGEVVVIDENSNALEVKKSSQPYDQKILGVVSSAPAIRISEDGGIWISKGDSSKTDTGYPIALTGRVPVKVSTENGAIKPGDYLTSSSVPGTAMKASKKGKVLGMALEGFNSSGIGKIKIFMDVSWYGP